MPHRASLPRREFTIRLTAADLEHAKPRDGAACVITRATRRELGETDVHMGYTRLRIGLHCYASRLAFEIARCFDRDGPEALRHELGQPLTFVYVRSYSEAGGLFARAGA